MNEVKKTPEVSVKTVYLYTASMLGLALFALGLVNTIQYSVKYFTGGYSTLFNIESSCEDTANAKLQARGIYLGELRQDPATICVQPNPYFAGVSIFTKTIDYTTGQPTEPVTEEEKATCLTKVEKIKADLQKEFDDTKNTCIESTRAETKFNQTAQFNSEISKAIALLAVGLPIWLFHWIPARRRG